MRCRYPTNEEIMWMAQSSDDPLVKRVAQDAVRQGSHQLQRCDHCGQWGCDEHRLGLPPAPGADERSE